MNASQFINSKTGRPIANHIIITTSSGQYLKSYESIVAFKPCSPYGMKVLGKDWDYSATTLRHVKDFMGWNDYSKKELLKAEGVAFKIDHELNF